ncbi:type II restriction enzyme NspV homolog [Calothrix sp. PCC 7716]|nr:type II restriction enzyme NspV homolog [Calothrix sp. PCC 7716]
MISSTHQKKLEYGDFQTPLELAVKVCEKLIELGVNPDVIIEPTCGVGNFIEAAAKLFKSAKKIIGVEINQTYLNELSKRDKIARDIRIDVKHADFYQFDWSSLISKINSNILVLGNFPWVTNSQQGYIGGVNLPNKNNFLLHSGLDAITGKSNFDISEWMLIQLVQLLQNQNACIAMLCKTAVARKILSYLHSNNLNISNYTTYKIDAKKYFNANVEACLLFCKFDSISKQYYCDVFESLRSSSPQRIGYYNNILVQDIDSFAKLHSLYNTSKKSQLQWRSGIKHDCSNVMEFKKINNQLVNGLGEIVDIEDTYLFPLMKGSDVAQNRIHTTERFVLVTQSFVGESTESIQDIAPKTWKYLELHANYLHNRKSKIYQGNPRFSIFGVGAYTFTSWKIAICGLYKKLDFKLVGKLCNKPAIFDDTVYFLSFDDEETANQTFKLLNSPTSKAFYSSLIFWDDKRPIKSSILNSLNLTALANTVKNITAHNQIL